MAGGKGRQPYFFIKQAKITVKGTTLFGQTSQQEGDYSEWFIRFKSHVKLDCFETLQIECRGLSTKEKFDSVINQRKIASLASFGLDIL